MPAAPHLIGDHLALDFLNSRVGPAAGEPSDWLADGAHFVDWLVAAGAVDAGVIRKVVGRKGAARTLDAVARQAHALRDWLAVFLDRHAERPLGRDALRELAPLNRLLERDETHRTIEALSSGSQPLVCRQVRRWTPDRLLMPVAEAIADLVCNGDFRLVRGCDGADCVLRFYDRTKAHGRRWCSMALCGNRAKAAAHRTRRREHVGR
jgi:predicted RNA-binding Zn ribbon-like protein